MKNRFQKQYISKLTLFFSLIVIVACRKEIPFDSFQGDRKIVLNSLIECDSIISAQICVSKFIQDNYYDFNPIENAEVLLYDANVLIDTLIYKGQGLYQNSITKGVKGKKYKLEVNATGYKSVSGVTTVVDSVPIISFDSLGMEPGQFGDDLVRLNLKFKDTQNETNYYRVRFTRYLVGYGKDYFYPESNDPAIEFSYSEGFYFTDVLFNGKEYSIDVQLPSYVFGGIIDSGYYEDTTLIVNENSYEPIYAILENLSEEYYLYSKSRDLQDEAQYSDLFPQAVIVYNNIENGFGIVGSKGTSIKSLKRE